MLEEVAVIGARGPAILASNSIAFQQLIMEILQLPGSLDHKIVLQVMNAQSSVLEGR